MVQEGNDANRLASHEVAMFLKYGIVENKEIRAKLDQIKQVP
jgi:hypothetical protein